MSSFAQKGDYLMEDQSRIFTDEEFGAVHVLGDIDAPLFCLTDVCHVLDLSVSNVVRRLRKEECSNKDLYTKSVLSKHPVKTAGGIQMLYFVNEDGFYDVILGSRKPIAIRFRKWVTSKVLPALRKTGKYSIVTPDKISTPVATAPAAPAVDLAAIQVQIDELKSMFKNYVANPAPVADSNLLSLQAQIDELRDNLNEQKEMLARLLCAFESTVDAISKRLTIAERDEKLLQIAEMLDESPNKQQILIKAANFFVGKKFV